MLEVNPDDDLEARRRRQRAVVGEVVLQRIVRRIRWIEQMRQPHALVQLYASVDCLNFWQPFDDRMEYRVLLIVRICLQMSGSIEIIVA